MKNIWDSEEAFTAYATIDASYFLLEQIKGELAKPTSPLDQMIDLATGYVHVRMGKVADHMIVCLKDIIDAKKYIEADYSSDEEMLKQIIGYKDRYHKK